MEHFHMDTRNDFISAELKPGEVIYCNPPRAVDIGVGTNGLQLVWKLHGLHPLKALGQLQIRLQ